MAGSDLDGPGLGTRIVDSDMTPSPSTLRTRRIMIGITVTLVIAMPVLNYYDSNTWEYVLAAALAFTIGTNAMISIVTIKVDDKADRMEARMLQLVGFIRTLLDQLEESSSSLKKFGNQMEQVDVPTMVSSAAATITAVERARTELAPLMEKLSDVDLAQISEFSVKALESIEMIDSEKVQGMIAPFMREEEDRVLLTLDEDPFFEDEIESLPFNWYPSPPPM
jgi:hypothetical protein